MLLGKQVAVGTSTRLDILWNDKEATFEKDVIQLYDFLQLVQSPDYKDDLGCLGDDVEQLEMEDEHMEDCPSPKDYCAVFDDAELDIGPSDGWENTNGNSRVRMKAKYLTWNSQAHEPTFERMRSRAASGWSSQSHGQELEKNKAYKTGIWGHMEKLPPPAGSQSRTHKGDTFGWHSASNSRDQSSWGTKTFARSRVECQETPPGWGTSKIDQGSKKKSTNIGTGSFGAGDWRNKNIVSKSRDQPGWNSTAVARSNFKNGNPRSTPAQGQETSPGWGALKTAQGSVKMTQSPWIQAGSSAGEKKSSNISAASSGAGDWRNNNIMNKSHYQIGWNSNSDAGCNTEKDNSWSIIAQGNELSHGWGASKAAQGRETMMTQSPWRQTGSSAGNNKISNFIAASPDTGAWRNKNIASKSHYQSGWNSNSVAGRNIDKDNSWGILAQGKEISPGWGASKTAQDSERMTQSPWRQAGYSAGIKKSSNISAGSSDVGERGWRNRNIVRKSCDESGWNSNTVAGSNAWGPLRTEIRTPWRQRGGPAWKKNTSNIRRGSSDAGNWRNKTNQPPRTPRPTQIDHFTPEEKHIFTEVDPILKSIRRIMNQERYTDGDPISKKDQSYIMDNVLAYHPDKATKLRGGIDHIMVSKHSSFQGSRCLYVVSLDSQKRDFSYRKCLENLVKEKYPDHAKSFLSKYLRRS